MGFSAPSHRPGMAARKPPAVPLPEAYRRMVRRLSSHSFQIIGLPVDHDAPEFPARDLAEKWLAKNLPALSRRLKRGPRACLCCGAEFCSDGPHNRLCPICRGGGE